VQQHYTTTLQITIHWVETQQELRDQNQKIKRQIKKQIIQLQVRLSTGCR